MDGISFCDKCSSTDIKEAHISEWETMYEQKYGKKFLDEE